MLYLPFFFLKQNQKIMNPGIGKMIGIEASHNNGLEGSPHSESDDSVPGFICFCPLESHLKWEGQTHMFSFHFSLYHSIVEYLILIWQQHSKGVHFFQ